MSDDENKDVKQEAGRRVEEPTQESGAGDAEAGSESAEGSSGIEGEAFDKVDESAGEAPKTLTVAQYEELMTLAQERDEFLKRLQRAVADYQNLSKRIENVRRQAEQETARKIIAEVLPIADSLARAVEAARAATSADDLVEGLKLIEKEFYATLEKLDVRPLEAVGEQFDPHYHDAVMRQPTDEAPPNQVVGEIKKGFVMGEKLLRPAQVIVSGPAEEAESEGEQSE